MLLALYRNLRFSLNQRFELELVLTRFAQLDTLITPSEVRDALQEMKGRAPCGPRDVKSARRSPAHGAAGGGSRWLPLRKIVDALRREKPALASALEKVEARRPGRGGPRPHLLRAGPVPGRRRSEGQGHAHRPPCHPSSPGWRSSALPTARRRRRPPRSTRGWSS